MKVRVKDVSQNGDVYIGLEPETDQDQDVLHHLCRLDCLATYGMTNGNKFDRATIVQPGPDWS